MSEETYYLTEYDGSVCRANPDGEDVALDEFEVVAELNRMWAALEKIVERIPSAWAHDVVRTALHTEGEKSGE